MDLNVASLGLRSRLASSVLLGMLVFSGCGSDISEYDQMKMAEQKAMDDLQAAGGKFEQRKYPQGEAWAVDLTGQQLTDETWDKLRSLDKISELNLSGTNLTDAHAEVLSDMEITGFLLKLDISKTEFSDAGLGQLKGMNLLRELNVQGSKVTKEGLQKFQQERNHNPAVMEMFRTVKVKM